MVIVISRRIGLDVENCGVDDLRSKSHDSNLP
jgi:hypothetical protein